MSKARKGGKSSETQQIFKFIVWSLKIGQHPAATVSFFLFFFANKLNTQSDPDAKDDDDDGDEEDAPRLPILDLELHLRAIRNLAGVSDTLGKRSNK